MLTRGDMSMAQEQSKTKIDSKEIEGGQDGGSTDSISQTDSEKASKQTKKLTEKLSEYVPDATVTVILKQINSLRAYVIGKVNNPGVFPITMDTTVMQVLAMARGLNPFASAGNIHILRRRQNVTVRIPFNYKEVEKGENYEQNIILQRGDVVVVP